MTRSHFESISEWQNKTFGQATALSKMAHLTEEIEELENELDGHDRQATMLEFADCFILLFGAANSYGMSYDDILAAIDEKMEINKARKWGEPKANGVINHVKDGEKC